MKKSLVGQTSQTADAADVFVCFDANLPKLEGCELDCETKKNVLCVHRFDHKVLVERCNTKNFWKWSDLQILLFFFGRILESIAGGSVTPDSVFIILTKDRNFVDDIKKEWEEKKVNKHLDLVFRGNSISLGGLTIFIQQIDCPNYGNARKDDLRCIFDKVNNFFLTKTDEA